MNVRPFLVLGASQRERLLQSLHADVDGWLRRWVGDSRIADLEIRLDETEPDEEVAGLCFGASTIDDEPAPWAVCATDAEGLGRLGCILLGERAEAQPSAGTVVETFALEALCELVNAWTGETGLASSMRGIVADLIPPEAKRPGRGTLVFSVSLGDASFCCWLPLQSVLSRIGTIIDGRRAGAAAPVKVAEAVADQGVKLRAMLGRIDLSLEEVSRLQPGDVVRLEKPITARLELRIEKSDDGFSGYLGKQQDRMAFRVVDRLTGNE